MWNRYTPGDTCALLIEKAAVRTSTDATLVLTTIVPSNHVPGRIVNVENHIPINSGGASGAAVRGVGNACGRTGPTTMLGGTATDLGEQAAMPEAIASAHNAARTRRKGFRPKPKHD